MRWWVRIEGFRCFRLFLICCGFTYFLVWEFLSKDKVYIFNREN